MRFHTIDCMYYSVHKSNVAIWNHLQLKCRPYSSKHIRTRWSFRITEYKISKIVTEKVSRDDFEQEIWTCFFLADFKFGGIISPVAHGNTGEFVGAESFGMYEMSLADGSCTFYPIYSDTFQRISQWLSWARWKLVQKVRKARSPKGLDMLPL